MEDETQESNVSYTESKAKIDQLRNKMIWFSVGEDSDKKTTINKDKLLKKSSSNKKQITANDIEEKLKKAELRRNNRYEKRVQKTIESREKMLTMASKLEKLRLHSNGERTLPKADFVKLAHEVSFEFEGLSERYKSDLSRAHDYLDTLQKNDL